MLFLKGVYKNKQWVVFGFSLGVLWCLLWDPAQAWAQGVTARFTDTKAVMLRFDQDTAAAVAALEEAVAAAQTALDKDKSELDILASIETALLARTTDEKVELVRRAQEALKSAGVAPDSDEAKAINVKVFGTEEIPVRLIDAEVIELKGAPVADTP